MMVAVIIIPINKVFDGATSFRHTIRWRYESIASHFNRSPVLDDHPHHTITHRAPSPIQYNHLPYSMQTVCKLHAYLKCTSQMHNAPQKRPTVSFVIQSPREVRRFFHWPRARCFKTYALCSLVGLPIEWWTNHTLRARSIVWAQTHRLYILIGLRRQRRIFHVTTHSP